MTTTTTTTMKTMILRNSLLLLLLVAVLSASSSEASESPPSLRERYLAATDPDHDGSLVTHHDVSAHPKIHAERLLETLGVGIHVFVQYKNDHGRNNVHANFTTVGYELDAVRTVAGIAPSIEHVRLLADDPDVEWIAEDAIVRAAGSETVPYTLQMTQYAPEQNVRQGSNANCRDSSTFKIGVVDSGMTAWHPDLICNRVGTLTSNCIGMTFGLSSSLTWYNPINYHGTHVSGIIAARKNNVGVIGMIEDDDVCILTARTLDDQGFGYFSSIMEGINWAVSMGAKVINVSIVGASYVQSLNQVFEDLYNKHNVLVIAAAGNDGGTGYSYPASYSAVMSVGAVNENRQKTVFSQSNNMVDIAGPGVDILSTLPTGRGNVIATVTVAGVQGFSGNYAEASPKSSVTGTLIFCQAGYVCHGPGNHICLMPNGGSPESCQNNGGVGVIVYNNSPIHLTDYSYTKASIPVMMVSSQDGQVLQGSYLDKSVRIDPLDGYGYMLGTSMATPHVSGAAAAIWRACPNCKNSDVEQCLLRTAMDINGDGKDNSFGYGLVQTQSAYACLQRSGCC